MANHALAALEDALRARQLDRTLTTRLAPPGAGDAAAPTGIPALDERLAGGLPRGQLSEIVGPRSSGRTLLLLQAMAAATRRGEIVALVDTHDRLDVPSVVAAGVDLDRLLWIRGDAVALPNDRVVERALKALNLILQAGGFGVVALDLADVPDAALRRIPFTTWPRLQRIVEGRDTACVLLGPQPLARSAGGVSVMMTARGAWTGESNRARRLDGMEVDVRLVSPRRHVEGHVRVRCDLRG